VKAKCVEYLGGKCKDCGNQFHLVIYDFDHKNPAEKEFKISGHYILRWKELKRELDKCELRCSNCHRLRHYMLESGSLQ
jgi:5-methylcytosine-specific restriction endonuclease McrA